MRPETGYRASDKAKHLWKGKLVRWSERQDLTCLPFVVLLSVDGRPVFAAYCLGYLYILTASPSNRWSAVAKYSLLLSMDAASVAGYAPAANGAVWTTTTVATIIFALRIYSRVSLKRGSAGWDDITMVLAWMTSLATSIVFSTAMSAGAHVSQTPESMQSDLPHAIKIFLIANAFAINALFFPKLSVALLLIRVLSPRRWVSAALLSAAALGIIAGVMTVIIEFVQCDPIPGQWNPAVYHPKCWNPNVQIDFSLFTGSLSAFLDFIFAIYPATVFFDLQMPRSRKIGVSILMGLGLVSGALGIYKTTLLPLLKAHNLGLQQLLLASVRLTMWTNIEANIIVIAACLPATSPAARLVSDSMAKYFGSLPPLLASFLSSHKKQYQDFPESTGNISTRDDVELITSNSPKSRKSAMSKTSAVPDSV